MAEELLRHVAGDRFDVASAGTNPQGLNPGAIAAMREIGIDIAHQQSKPVDQFAGKRFDHVITVCDPGQGKLPDLPGNRIRPSIGALTTRRDARVSRGATGFFQASS